MLTEKLRRTCNLYLPTSARLAAAVALAVGCGAESTEDADALALEQPCVAMDAGLDESPADGGTLGVDASVRPDGGASAPFVASVTANGTGCRPGTWSAHISRDGQDFTVTFSEYFAEVTPKLAVAVKDCQLAVKLHSSQGLSYSLSEFSYPGYALLEEDVTAQQTVGYYFQGNPVTSEQARTELKGKYDDTYLFEAGFTTSDAVVWSPCGTERDLNIKTLLRLQNSNPQRSGYVTLETIRMPKLRWRKCGAGRP